MPIDLSSIQGNVRGQNSLGIRDAIAKYKELRSQMQEGKLSQADFISQVGQFMPESTRIGVERGRGGERSSKQANAEGLYELYDLAREYSAYSAAKDLLGRDITTQEVAQFMPKFEDPFKPETGRAYLAELAKQEANSPEALAKKAPQYSGQVNDTFQQLLSRGASKEEADYFGRLLATGQVSPYEVQQFVQALPEYQNIQDKNFRGSLEGELAQYDEKAFGRERENILSQYTKAGLQNSSALDFAITDALGKVQEQRGQYLAGLSSQQYGGNKAAARSDYENLRGRYQEGQDYGRNRSDAYLDYLTQRADASADYNRQKADYLDFLSKQPKQKGGGVGQTIGGVGGGIIGAIYGGPAGAGAGYQIGSGVGSGFDYLNS